MAELLVTLRVPLPRETVWRRLWSPDRHTDAIPLTRVTTVPASSSMAVQGTRVLARTACGPWGFDDVMVCTSVAAAGAGPWTCRVAKVGSSVRGEILATVTEDEDGSTVRWRQRITIAGFPPVADPVVAAVAWLAYRSGIRRIVGG